MQQYLVLGVRSYRFADQNTGQMIEGITVHYCDHSDVTPAGQGYGMQPMKISAPMNILKKFEKAPGIFKLDFVMRPGHKGQPQLRLADAEFIKPLSF